MGYSETYASQVGTAIRLYGEQTSARAYSSNRKAVPYTPTLYAGLISNWYYRNLQSIAQALIDAEDVGWFELQSVRNVIGRRLAKSLAVNTIDAFAGDSPIGERFPVGLLIDISEVLGRSNETDTAVLRVALYDMGVGASKALAAMASEERATGNGGIDVMSPENATLFWDGWRQYANAAGSALFTPDQASVWESIKESINELPETVKAAAEKTGELAADALVFAAETGGRAAKGFFGELGIFNTAIAGGAIYLGFKTGVL